MKRIKTFESYDKDEYMRRFRELKQQENGLR